MQGCTPSIRILPQCLVPSDLPGYHQGFTQYLLEDLYSYPRLHSALPDHSISNCSQHQNPTPTLPVLLPSFIFPP